MKKFLSKLDQKYLKICVYAGAAVLITVCLTVLCLSTGPFWKKLWSIFCAVMKPVVIGAIICYLLLPAVNWLEGFFNRKKQHKWARMLAILLTFLIIICLIMIILVLITAAIYKNVESVNAESIKNLVLNLKDEYTDIWAYLEKKLSSFDFLSVNVRKILQSVANAISGFFSGLLFGTIFSVYFLLDVKGISGYWSRTFRLLCGDKAYEKLGIVMKDLDTVFSGYIRGQAADALIAGTMIAIALSVAGIPSAVIVGVFAGLGNLIPYFGPVVGYAMVVVVCLPTRDFGKMLVGLIVLAVIMFIDGNIINPRLLSSSIHIHPLLVVAALIGGAAIGGIVGMLVAVPMAAFLKLQFDRYLQKVEEGKRTAAS